MPSRERDSSNSVDTIRNSKKIMHLPGAIVGNRYQIIQQLGTERLGRTYLAKDLQATGDSRCVIEQLRPQLDSPQAWVDARACLEREFAVLQRLGEHAQIAQFFVYFVADQQFYLVREYIDGEGLEREIKRRVFSEAQAIYLLQDVLRILDFVHKTNVIHRDIQPAHLIRRKTDDRYVLISMGLIQEIETIETIETKGTGQIISSSEVGKKGYVAPEQKAGKPGFGSDIYALGKTIIYALTGRSPREWEKSNDCWYSNCHISNKLRQIIDKMVAAKIEDRYQSALEVLLELKPLLKIEQVVGGRYRLTHYLGGKAEIDTYVAENLRRQYQSPCLIKQIQLADSDPAVWAKMERRFTEELSLLERLGYHDRIPQLWDHFEEDEAFYLVLEYIEGENLAQKLQQQNFTEAEVIQILEDALSVLAFIHQHRIIHRHLKPSNLMIRHSDGQIMLTDFGILEDIKTIPKERVANNQDEEQKNYLPPEQIAGRPTLNSDIYALGMIAIELLTGKQPHQLPKNKETGAINWREEITVNRRLAKIIDKMTSLDVGQRYQSAEKVINDLLKLGISPHKPVVEQLETPPVLPKTQLRDKQWLRPIHIVVGILGLVTLLGSIEFAFPTWRPLYYWYRGKQTLEQEPETALKIFMKAIDLKPASHLAWEGRGEALYRLERFPEALEAQYEAIQLNPNEPKNWQQKGDILYRLDRFSEAVIAYEQVLEINPQDGVTLNQKGKALYQLERYQEALNAHDAALEIEPLNPQFLSERAKTLIGLERYYDALTVLNRVQAIAPKNPQLWQAKVLALKYLNRPQEAQRVRREVMNTYDKLAQQQPDNEEIWLTKGNFLHQTSAYSEAIAAYQQAIAIKRNDYEAWLGVAEAALALEKYNQALTALDKTLQIRPESYLAWQIRGQVWQNVNNNLTEAIAAYERAIEINPNFAPAWQNLALALKQQGKYRDAIESFTEASEINPQNIDTWLGLADTLNTVGREQEALEALDRALAINPQKPKIWLEKGSIFLKNQNYNQACNTYRQSRAFIPNSPEITEIMNTVGCRLEDNN